MHRANMFEHAFVIVLANERHRTSYAWLVATIHNKSSSSQIPVNFVSQQIEYYKHRRGKTKLIVICSEQECLIF